MRLFLTSLALGLTLGLGSALAQPVALTGRLITDALDQPVYATAPPADPRLFVVEQTGRIRIIVDGKLTDTPFLDLSGSISSGGEQGLLGLAFHPGYADNGRFFVNYTDKDGDTHIVGYKVSADPAVADPASA
ncbi:MAG: PQQ-dependent sugar dehydrogenase, partial [Devosia sp.]|nr:PQQ-dependent sugar dehydrogenase [Devosia sp.]